MIDRFESALWKVDRARKHADDLEAEVRSFWAVDPYEIETVGSLSASQGSYRVKRMTAVPESIPLIAGDAAHNIRSALDHFAWAAASPQERGVHTCFPVWNRIGARTDDKWQKQVAQQMKGASAELIEAAMKLEAWPTGRDSLLWAIHELDRVDKHRLLLPVAVALTRIDLYGDSYELAVAKKFSGFDPSGPLALAPLNWTPLEDRAELLGFPDGADFGATQTTLSVDMMLGEPEMLRDKSAITQLRILAGLAEEVIRDLAPLA
jgi:hypothetical protein